MGLLDFLQQMMAQQGGAPQSNAAGQPGTTLDFSNADVSNISQGIAGMSGANPQQYAGTRNDPALQRLIEQLNVSGMDKDKRDRLLRTMRRPVGGTQRPRSLFG